MKRLELSGRQAALVVFLASLAYFASFMAYGLAYDEGYLLDSVVRILDGQVIYRDFHHTYAPGSFYLLAGLFKIFGRNILVERALFAALEALKCVLAFLIVRRVSPTGFAYLAPVLMAIAPGPWHKVFFPAFGFLALYAVLVAMGRGPRWYLLAGVTIGASAVFRQDVAGFAIVGACMAIAIEAARTRLGPAEPARRLAWLAAGLGLAVGPVALYFYSRGALGAMVHKIAVDGMLDNMTNRIPYPRPGALTGVDLYYVTRLLPVKAFFYLPFAAYLLVLVVVGRALAARTWTERHTALAVVLVTSVLAFNQSTFRSDIGHVLQTMQYVFLLVPVLVASGRGWLARRFGLGSRGRAALASGFAAAVALFVFWVTLVSALAVGTPQAAARFQKEGVSLGDTEYIGSMLVRLGNTANLGLERAPIMVSPGEARFFQEIKRALDADTSPGEYVLAVPQLQMLYFLFDRRNPTRYAHYRRRLSPEEEARYIEDIKAHGTNYVLLTEPFEGAKFGQTSESFSEYARPVREWLLQNYAPVQRIGWVTFLRRRQ